MFTGIVEEIGTVKSIAAGARSVKIAIAARKVLEDVRMGDSIAVNGTCLTVVAFSDAAFTADAMPETVRLTGLSRLKPGDPVNLERALTFGARLGGHLVSGHVDGMGRIASLRRDDNAVVIEIEAASELLRYIIKKGSVAIDGVSLTVVASGETCFSVSIIPHTFKETVLGSKSRGDTVNIETDVIGKYVERFLQPPASSSAAKESSVTADFLREHGF